MGLCAGKVPLRSPPVGAPALDEAGGVYVVDVDGGLTYFPLIPRDLNGNSLKPNRVGRPRVRSFRAKTASITRSQTVFKRFRPQAKTCSEST